MSLDLDVVLFLRINYGLSLSVDDITLISSFPLFRFSYNQGMQQVLIVQDLGFIDVLKGDVGLSHLARR